MHSIPVVSRHGCKLEPKVKVQKEGAVAIDYCRMKLNNYEVKSKIIQYTIALTDCNKGF